MPTPDPQAVNDTAAKLLGSETETPETGTIFEIVQRYAQAPAAAQELLRDLIEVVTRHQDHGLDTEDALLALVGLLATGVDLDWFESDGRPSRYTRLHRDASTTTEMILDDIGCAHCARLVGSKILLALQITHAAALQRRSADRRENGHGD